MDWSPCVGYLTVLTDELFYRFWTMSHYSFLYGLCLYKLVAWLTNDIRMPDRGLTRADYALCILHAVPDKSWIDRQYEPFYDALAVC